MVWNHRVMRRVHQLPSGGSEVEYGIHEVFYDENGDGKLSWTVEPVAVVGESLDSLRQTLQWMLDALDKEVLNYDRVPDDQTQG